MIEKPNLGEAHGDCINMLQDVFRLHIESNDGIHQTRSVHVHLQVVFVRHRSQLHLHENIMKLARLQVLVRIVF